MIIVYEKVMVVKSSSAIMFLKRVGKEWKEYFRFDNMRGNIYYIRGNVRIQIVTDERIFYVLIDKETFIPTIENVQFNNLKCDMMMFGRRVRNAISFKYNYPGFIVYKRKFYHNFKVKVSGANCEGAKGCHLSKMKAYAVG